MDKYMTDEINETLEEEIEDEIAAEIAESERMAAESEALAREGDISTDEMMAAMQETMPELKLDENGCGKLYIVATPIGNTKDMSPRGRYILEHVDLIAAEDTRRSIILLNILGIRNRLISNHKFNEHGKTGYFVNVLKSGKNMAVISDAGTPCISDPGNELIKAAIAAGIEVIGVPGCCAAVTALCVSGFDLSNFFFYGFFPRESGPRKKVLEAMKQNTMTRTYVFYESPRRIMDVIEFFEANGSNMQLCLCNDLTKVHEKAFRGTPHEVKEQLLNKGNYDKGEFVLVVEVDEAFLADREEHAVSAESLIVDTIVSGRAAGTKEAVNYLLEKGCSYSKNELKKAAINLKELF